MHVLHLLKQYLCRYLYVPLVYFSSMSFYKSVGVEFQINMWLKEPLFNTKAFKPFDACVPMCAERLRTHLLSDFCFKWVTGLYSSFNQLIF